MCSSVHCRKQQHTLIVAAEVAGAELSGCIKCQRFLGLQGPAPSPAAYDDGLVEVYGLTAGALKQGWNVRTVESHTKRLGQGHGLKLYVMSSDAAEHSVYTLMDGEDWWQRVPAARPGTSVRDGMLVRPSAPVPCCVL